MTLTFTLILIVIIIVTLFMVVMSANWAEIRLVNHNGDT